MTIKLCLTNWINCPSSSSWWDQTQDDAGGQREFWGEYYSARWFIEFIGQFEYICLADTVILFFLNWASHLKQIPTDVLFDNTNMAVNKGDSIVVSISECDILASVLHLLGTHHPSLPHLSPGRRGTVSTGKANAGMEIPRTLHVQQLYMTWNFIIT